MKTPIVVCEQLFSPIQIGPMRLRNRIMLPPHGRVTGNPFGTEEEAQRFYTYWGNRARDGAAWLDGLNCFMGNSVVIPGFEPQGLGATIGGVFRLSNFRERAARYASIAHQAGACATGQIIVQGGMPHSPSGLLANYSNNLVPHILSQDEILWLIEEYAFSAGELQAAGLDGVELHANHEDVLQLFMSPATNRREDAYGGDQQGRLKLIVDILAAIRAKTGPSFCVGIRMNMDELLEGGYDVEQGIELAKALQATGHLDYFHGVIGNNWGAPSYIQPHQYEVAQWADIAARFKQSLSLPVVYTGRVSDMRSAERIIASGQADVVGIARAMFADGNSISKARAGQFNDIRPCIGTNDCLHRIIVEGLSFGCSVNPRTGYEHEPALDPASPSKRVLVIGAGPGGMEVAALLGERGHQVELWEQNAELGGQMHVAAQARENEAYGRFIAFQARRLAKAGVTLHLNTRASVQTVRDAAPQVVIVATGARPRRPNIPGIDLPSVVEGRDLMLGSRSVGQRVTVVAMEDHMQPLTIAGFLVDQGKQVRVIYPGPAVAPLVGKYSIGAAMAKLGRAGVEFRVMQRVEAVQPQRLLLRDVYSGTQSELCDFDSSVLACGGDADNSLYHALQGDFEQVHVLGDAYAPRRISFATRQAYALAKLI